MTLAAKTVTSKESLRSWLGKMILTMPNVSASADDLTSYLIERSGMLTSPTASEVSFVHRMFQDYLAAYEAAVNGYSDTLISMAHLDGWWDVIVLACGHAATGSREHLLSGILDRAESDHRHARRLRILAVACLETSVTLDADLLQRIENVASRLVPPRSVREVESLLNAGVKLVDYLPQSTEEFPVASAVATVRLAAKSATPKAAVMLRRYSSDLRAEVQRELLRYREILSATLDDG
jgi:hypothetical protein